MASTTSSNASKTHRPEPQGHERFWINFWPWLLLAGLLRFWDLGSLPFTNDELSALSRLSASSLQELIHSGIRPDAHPAFTQLWLWAWTSALGEEAWLVRTPFILASLAAMSFCCKLLWMAYGKQASMLGAALMAASQPLLFFSVVGRPYAFGLLWGAATAYVWYRIVCVNKQGYWYYLSYAVLLSLCVYTHYFSGLLAVLGWISGWLYWKKLKPIPYFLSAAVGALLFLPHMGITLDQINHKGIGNWLRAPTPSFATEWLMAQLNYSYLVLAVLGVTAIIAAAHKPLRWPKTLPVSVVWASWLLLSLGIGYAYSVRIDPLLHHGTLLFASPFLLMAIVAWIRPAQPFLAKSLPILLFIIMSFTLFQKRRHYEVMAMQAAPFIASTLSSVEAAQWAVIRQNEAFMQRFFSESPAQSQRIHNLTGTTEELKALLQEAHLLRPNTIYLDGTEPILLRQLQHHYYTEMLHDGFTFTGFMLRKGEPNEALYQTLRSDSSTLTFNTEYFTLLHASLDTLPVSFADHIAATVQYTTAQESAPQELHLVCELKRGEELIHWSSAQAQHAGMYREGRHYLSHQLLLWDYFLRHREMQGVTVSLYLWNPKAEPIELLQREAAVMPGGHNRYGLLYRRP